MIATVAMQSFHMPKYPIRIKAITLPTTNFQLLEPNQASTPRTNNIIGQGVANNSFSNLIKKNNKDIFCAVDHGFIGSCHVN